MLALAPRAPAHAPGVVLSGSGTATIDGAMRAGEWAGAGRLDFPVNLSGGGTTQGTIFVMNDATNLYLAFRIVRPILDRSHVGFWFDDDHDGVSTPGREDGVSFGTGDLGGLSDEFRCATGFCRDVDAGGRIDGQGAAANDGTASVYELSKPLASGDLGHDFELSGVGRRIGFTAIVTLPGGSGDVSSCVPVCNVLDPASFGDIVLAAPPAPPPPPIPPPPQPPPSPPPPKVGVVARAWMSLPNRREPVTRVRKTTGLQANFRFKLQPVAGARLRLTWYDNGKRFSSSPRERATLVTSLVISSRGLSPGSYKAILTVKPPGSSYRRVAVARAKVG
jgi:hypothetical protein